MEERTKVFTIANALTLLRLVLALPVGYLIVTGERGVANLAALAIFIVAALTDGLDGHLARARGEITKLGKLLDPIADKVLGLTVFAALALHGSLPAWALWTLIGKESVLLFGGAAILGSGGSVSAARFLGKISTVVLFIGFTLVLAGFGLFGEAVVLLGVALSLGAGIDYIMQFVKDKNRAQ